MSQMSRINSDDDDDNKSNSCGVSTGMCFLDFIYFINICYAILAVRCAAQQNNKTSLKLIPSNDCATVFFVLQMHGRQTCCFGWTVESHLDQFLLSGIQLPIAEGLVGRRLCVSIYSRPTYDFRMAL